MPRQFREPCGGSRGEGASDSKNCGTKNEHRSGPRKEATSAAAIPSFYQRASRAIFSNPVASGHPREPRKPARKMLIGARHAAHTYPPRFGSSYRSTTLSRRFKVRGFYSVSLLSAADPGAHRKDWLSPSLSSAEAFSCSLDGAAAIRRSEIFGYYLSELGLRRYLAELSREHRARCGGDRHLNLGCKVSE